MEDIVGIIFVFGGATICVLSLSPIGRAIADRIRGSGNAESKEALEQLRESQITVLDELDALRQEMAEVNERVDFAERLLAKQREPRQLPEGGMLPE